jgi:calcineurin-like phosphoesterase family protein
MYEVLLENHNRLVKPTDLTFHLGDYTFDKDVERVYKSIKKFNGNHIFLKGSHDYWQTNYSKKYLIDFRDIKEIVYQKTSIVMCHYCMLTWSKSHYGSWHLFGHHHGMFTENVGKSYDVGVDGNGYKPVSFDEIVEIMKTRPENINRLYR